MANNVAGGNQQFEANFNFDLDPLWTSERNQWVFRLADELRRHLQTRRFMIVLLAGSSDDQSEFWSSLWTQVRELVDEGLLLVRMVDENSEGHDYRPEECRHDCEVVLAPLLDGDDVAHAIEDVSALIQESIPGMDAEGAAREARGYVLGHRYNVSEVHDRLLRFVSDLQEF